MAVIEQNITDRWAVYNGDCIEVMKSLPANKIHLSVYSPPFGGLYHYSSSERDLSNCADYGQFFDHYAYVVKEIARITMPGRISAVHCMDVPSSNTGNDHYIDFPGDIIRLHEKHKFRYIARYCVWKEPLGVRNRTLMKSLAHKTIVTDSSKCSVASADYLIVFRKAGENPEPIAHPTGLSYYAGARKMPADRLRFKDWEGDQKQNRYSHWIWRQYASAFWDDIRLNRVLPFKPSKEQDDEKHVHPLQRDVIERCIHLWSNPGDTVFTPFMGVGSEVYEAVRCGRKGIGAELKPSYYKQTLRNLAEVDAPEREQDGLWDGVDEEYDEAEIERLEESA